MFRKTWQDENLICVGEERFFFLGKHKIRWPLHVLGNYAENRYKCASTPNNCVGKDMVSKKKLR